MDSKVLLPDRFICQYQAAAIECAIKPDKIAILAITLEIDLFILILRD